MFIVISDWLVVQGIKESSKEKPFFGRASPKGDLSFTLFPFSFIRESVNGLKVIFPEMAIAVTISGDEINASVNSLPSFLALKFLLNEVIMELGCFSVKSFLFHCPMQGPQELESIIAPKSSSSFKIPSFFNVSYICVEPGDT